MQNPLVVIRNIIAPKAMTKREAAAVEYTAMIPPYLRSGYRPPTAPTAAELMRKQARWPLIWVTDIHGFDSVGSRSSGQTAFTLTQPGEHDAGASFQCRIPIHEGKLFDKEGTYLLVAVPATDEEQIARIMEIARGA